MYVQPGVLVPDGVGYFAYLPSTYFDHDLLFFDEWAKFGLIRGSTIRFKDVTSTDHLSNHWTVGPAIVWYPAYLAGDLLQRLVAGFPRNGISLPYNVPVMMTSATSGLLALLAGFAMARRRFGDWPASLAAIGIWFGSPLLWYSLRHATMSHAAGAVACALVVLLSVRLRESITVEKMFSVGLAIGVATIIRPQNAPFLLVPFLLVAGADWCSLLRRTPALILGGAMASLPQIVVSMALYGSPLAFANVGGAQRGNNWHAFERVWLGQTLFSSYHGMFVWTPLLAVAIAGFVFLYRADRGLGISAVTMFGIQWAMNSLLDRTFWSGASFGQRRFDNCTIFFLLGLAAILVRMPRWAAVVVTTAGAAWTMSLFFATRVLDLNVYQTGAELLDAQLRTLSDPHLGILLFVPTGARSLVLVLLLAAGIVLGAIALLFARLHDPRLRSAVAATYLGLCSLLLLLCARNDASHLAPWKGLIAHVRAAGQSGAVESEAFALANEYDYLRRSGQSMEAERTLQDLRRLTDSTQRR